MRGWQSQTKESRQQGADGEKIYEVTGILQVRISLIVENTAAARKRQKKCSLLVDFLSILLDREVLEPRVRVQELPDVVFFDLRLKADILNLKQTTLKDLGKPSINNC